MNPYLGELIGTFILMFLGNGINANISLKDTYGNSSGWMLTSMGWGLAVFTAIFITGSSSGAHINPAVTIGLAVAGEFSWSMAPGYIGMPLLGAFLGVHGELTLSIVYILRRREMQRPNLVHLVPAPPFQVHLTILSPNFLEHLSRSSQSFFWWRTTD
ncbi:MAG: aquaporin family protein [Ekhidna sp.]|nr:aquaporin family protein [Ekhidna sp.]